MFHATSFCIHSIASRETRVRIYAVVFSQWELKQQKRTRANEDLGAMTMWEVESIAHYSEMRRSSDTQNRNYSRSEIQHIFNPQVPILGRRLRQSPQ